MTDCVFCPQNWDNLDIIKHIEHGVPFAILNPLNPVTEGHVLVISSLHSDSAAADPHIAGTLMRMAAQYVAEQGIEANIITSIGPLATQSVFHTQVHIVPRRLNDDLPLPWTPQQMDKERWRRAWEVGQQLMEGGVND